MKVGDLIELELDGLDDRGHGRGSHGERELSVPGAFPGEQVRVRVEALARHSTQAHARLRELLRPSPDRRALPCEHHEHAKQGSCGGCPLMALEHRAQLEHARAWLKDRHGLELDAPIVAGDELGYRWSSKRVVGGRRGRLILGSRESGRHGVRIADMRGCLVDHPKIAAAFAAVERLGSELDIEGWRGSGNGDLRYVWAKTNGRQVLLTLICGDRDGRAATELAPRLYVDGHADGVAQAIQDEPGNAIRGRTPKHLVGLEALEFELCGERLELGPLGFLQPNPIMAARAYEDLVGGAHGQLAFDLYAGIGVTTALLRRRFAQVVACESHEESAEALGVAPSTAEDFCRSWLADDRERPELIVANPPRAGLGQAVCEAVLELRPSELRIMSCSAKTLAEDLGRLAPAYELEQLRAYDMLPQTLHLELVARLRRR